MTEQRTSEALIGGVGLLERALTYTLGSLRMITPDAMPSPTPCRGWDLRALLAHMNDSLLALQEAADLGHVDLDVPADAPADAPADGVRADPATAPVAALRNRACRLLGAWTNLDGPQPVQVAEVSLTTSLVASTGAIEVTVHGWDVARACGGDRPIPPALAEELLPLAPLFVTDDDRPGRFGPLVELPLSADVGDHLLGFLGRDPR